MKVPRLALFSAIIAIIVGVLSACGRESENNVVRRRGRGQPPPYDHCYADYYCYGHGWTDYEYDWRE